MSSPDSPSLSDDLATVRSIVSQASDATAEQAATVDRLEAVLAAALVESERLANENDGLREMLGRAEQPLNFDQSGLASLSDAEAVRAVHERVRAAAKSFDKARYRGISGEVWDLLRIFRVGGRPDPVTARAARHLLGQEIPDEED